jgi:hypothetical protein
LQIGNKYFYKAHRDPGYVPEVPETDSRAAPPLRFYGASQIGGGTGCVDNAFSGCGTLYELVEPKDAQSPWTHNVLHVFDGGPAGSFPIEGGTLGPDYAIYGIAKGGTDCAADPDLGCGVVYRLKPPSKYEVLHRFKGGRGGAVPFGRLVLDQAGNVYGITSEGGGCCGTIYKLTKPKPPRRNWVHKVLHQFQSIPAGGLLLHDNALYGVTTVSVYKLSL